MDKSFAGTVSIGLLKIAGFWYMVVLFSQMKILFFQNKKCQFSQKNETIIFELFFEPIKERHNYNRLNSNCCYSLPKARTNVNNGKFALRFAGVKTWNAIEWDGELRQADSISSLRNL